MTLYELTQAMENFDLEIDPYTGEILNADELDQLQMEHDEKLKNCVHYYKNMLAEAEAIKAEKLRLADRQRTAEKKAEWIKSYIAMDLNGEKFEPKDDVTVRVGWRKSTAVECDDVFKVSDEYLRYKEPELDRKKVKEALKAGEEVAGCYLVTRNNISIK